MTEHIFLPGIRLESVRLIEDHKKWLLAWMNDSETHTDKGDVSSSMCLQGLISEVMLYGEPKTDWIGVMDEYLINDNGFPIAYSEEFGKRLYRFCQWFQKPVHAIHTRWWIDRICNSSQNDDSYKKMIENLIQKSGWIYNPDVSPTGIGTRMKSELMMSTAMGTEILKATDSLKKYKNAIEAALSSQPLTGSLSTEYFRTAALNTLGSPELAPVGLGKMITGCAAGEGYCDFSMLSKLDDYMGTAKRTIRDKPVHSSLASLHASYLAQFCDKETQKIVQKRIKDFGMHLKSNPLDIPAFTMRDLDVPFGTDVTPLEIVSTSFIVTSC